MENKTARLTLLIDPDKKAAFEALCARQDRTASQVVRQLIRDYLSAHGVSYGPGAAPSNSSSSAAADDPDPAPAPRTRPRARNAPAPAEARAAQRGARRRRS